MTGLFLLGVAGLWLVAALFISVLVARKLPKRPWRLPLTAIMFLALFPLPLVDEVVGGIQFKQLCKQHSTIQVDRAKAAGRTVYLLDLPQTNIEGPWVPVKLYPWRFVDAVTKEIIVSYDVLYAEGGRLFPGFDSGHEPLTFKGICAPGGGVRVDNGKLLSELGVTRIERPDSRKGEVK